MYIDSLLNIGGKNLQIHSDIIYIIKNCPENKKQILNKKLFPKEFSLTE